MNLYEEFEEEDLWKRLFFTPYRCCEACDEVDKISDYQDWITEIVEPYLWGIDVRCGLYVDGVI